MKHFFFKKNKDYQKIDENFYSTEKMDVTTLRVTKFYTDHPFPNYENLETIRDLSDKLQKNIFLSNFKKQIGFGKKIIEVGSGTSQLSLMLAHNTNNLVVAFDPTLASITLGKEFADKNSLKNCFFLNGDIFDDPIEHETFDIVWCTGVLHHTKDSNKAFDIITQWLKPEGIIIIGLYNKFGRFRTNFRQYIYKLLGKSIGRKYVKIFDPYLRNNISKIKADSWINDQYEHPVERSHTIDEVLKWFNNNNISFLNSIPSADLSEINYKNLFEKRKFGNMLTRVISQILMLFSRLGSEGGLFIVIGKKNK